MTPVDASNDPDEARYSFNFKNIKPKLKSEIMPGMLTNVTFSLKDTLLIGTENHLQLLKF